MDASNKSDENEVKTKKQSDTTPSDSEIRGKSGTDTIQINTEDVVQVKKSSSLRDFISLSLSVGAEVKNIEYIAVRKNDIFNPNSPQKTKVLPKP